MRRWNWTKKKTQETWDDDKPNIEHWDTEK